MKDSLIIATNVIQLEIDDAMNFEEDSLKQAGISGNVRRMTPLGGLV